MSENRVTNPQLAVNFDGWKPFEDGFVISPEGKIVITSSDERSLYGAKQKVHLNQTEIKKILIKGSAICKNVSGKSDKHFSVYLDIKHTDESSTFGIAKEFDVTNEELQEIEFEHTPKSPIKYVKIHLLFRYHSGFVIFNEVSLCEAELEDLPKSNPLKIIFPGYVYPGRKWDQMIEKESEDSHITQIANPHNGPSTQVNEDYRKYITKAIDAGMDVVGYVATGYGKRIIKDIRTDVDRWYQFYPNIKGIFFDEASNKLEFVEHYRELCDYARSKNRDSHVITHLNPGTKSIPEYDDVADVVFTFESYENTWLETEPQEYIKNDKNPYNHAALVHTSTQLEKSLQKAVDNNYGYIFVTDDKHSDGNPWDSIPGNWDQEIEWIRKHNQSLN